MSLSACRLASFGIPLVVLLGLGCAGIGTSADRVPAGGESIAMTTIDTVHDAVSVVAEVERELLVLGACPTGVTQLGSANVFSTPMTGGAATVLNTTSLWGSPAGLVISGDSVLVAVHPEPEGHQPTTVQPMNGIYSVPLQGGKATPLWEGEPLVKPNRMVLVDHVLYIADMNGGPDGAGAIFRMPVSGGRPEAVWRGSPLEDPIGIEYGHGGLFIADRGTPTRVGAPNNDPGSPGRIFHLPLESGGAPNLVAYGGRLKNPLDLELVGDLLFIADEGVDTKDPQGVYAVSLAGWSRGQDLTSSIDVVRAGSPFKEPLALAHANGKLYVVDDTQSQSYVIDVAQVSKVLGYGAGYKGEGPATSVTER